MNNILAFALILFSSIARTQSFAPAPGELGSTAIHKDSSIIVNWATGIVLTRGYLNVANPSAGNASFGEEAFALGAAEGDGTTVVSLGDSGVATLTFSSPIINLSGPDFAVFENGFADNYMEFAYVEVSSDGINFFRFPSVSETPLSPQMGNFSFGDCRYVHNLAGKYRQGFGTPFDLEELVNEIGLDVNNVTHVRLIDVIGSVDPAFGTMDSFGNLINDNYPTEFASGGFDLDGVAVLHEMPAGLNENTLLVKMYPNPTSGNLNITTNGKAFIRILNTQGQLLAEYEMDQSIKLDLSEFKGQLLFVEVITKEGIFTERIRID